MKALELMTSGAMKSVMLLVKLAQGPGGLYTTVLHRVKLAVIRSLKVRCSM